MTRASAPAPVAAPGSFSRRRIDERPWYRQFWPWFLIALPAATVAFSFATLFIALREADTVVPHEGDSTSYSAPREPAQAVVAEPAATGDSAPVPPGAP